MWGKQLKVLKNSVEMSFSNERSVWKSLQDRKKDIETEQKTRQRETLATHTYNWPYVVSKFDDPGGIISNSQDKPMLMRYEYYIKQNRLEIYGYKHQA